MSYDPAVLGQRLQVAEANLGRLAKADLQRTAEDVEKNAGKLIRHRDAFLKESQHLAARNLVVAGKAANVATSLYGASLLFTAPPFAGAGILAGVVGAGCSIASSLRDWRLDEKSKAFAAKIPEFQEEDERLTAELQASYTDFCQLLGLGNAPQQRGDQDPTQGVFGAAAAPAASAASAAAHLGLDVSTGLTAQRLGMLTEATRAAESAASAASQTAAQAAARAEAATSAVREARAAFQAARAAAQAAAAQADKIGAANTAAQAAAQKAAEVAAEAGAKAQEAMKAMDLARAAADGKWWRVWGILIDAGDDTMDMVWKSLYDKYEVLEIAKQQALQASDKAGAAAAEAGQRLLESAAAQRSAEMGLNAAQSTLRESLTLKKALVEEAAKAGKDAAAAGSKAAEVAAQGAQYAQYWRYFGYGAAVFSVGMSVRDLGKAFGKNGEVQWKDLHKIVKQRTAEADRIRGIARNFLTLSVSLIKAAPTPARGGHLERLLAYALTRDLDQKSFFDLLTSQESLSGILDFDLQHSRMYSLQPHCYGVRGGFPYHKPTGWARYALRKPDFDLYKDWCIAYHGTSAERGRGVQLGIMLQGLRRPAQPRQKNQCHSETGQSIYVTPAIEYAAQYSDLIPLQPLRDHWVQVVFECRVRPGTFKRARSTLWHRWEEEEVRHDANFCNCHVEWLLEDSAHVVITGMMVRELGAAADAQLFGSLATKVRADFEVTSGDGETFRGPRVHWNRLRQEDLQERTCSREVAKPFPPGCC